MILMMAVAMLIGIGATALISIRLGEQKKDEAEKIAGNAITLLVIFSLLFTGVYFLFADSLLLMFGADQDVLPYARDFTHIIMLGSVFGAIGFGANNFIRAEGNPTIAMLTSWPVLS
jgi:Na+-driven multidrug efflux pump